MKYLAQCSNRTIVGLKLTGVVSARWSDDRQQSHHCGIETPTASKNFPSLNRQQSHHCGIETILTTYQQSEIGFAAIAPLWD